MGRTEGAPNKGPTKAQTEGAPNKSQTRQTRHKLIDFFRRDGLEHSGTQPTGLCCNSKPDSDDDEIEEELVQLNQSHGLKDLFSLKDLKDTSIQKGGEVAQPTKEHLEDPFIQVMSDFKLKTYYDSWMKDQESLIARVREHKEKLRNTKNNDIYQFLGLYSVFQGVFLGAVFQASDIKCGFPSWTLLLLSIVASVAAFIGLILREEDKLNIWI